ncbi:amidohydrolase family protein [Luedemannella flava]
MTDHLPYDLVIRAARAVTGAGETTCAVAVSGGRIAAVTGVDDPLPAHQTIRLAPDTVLLPGLIDTHVHLQDPGGTGWEDFAHGTTAAAAGGFTTVVDMPLDSSPVTTSVAALTAKRAAARGRCHIDVGFWGGVVPGNLADLAPLRAAGALGFKCFLGETGNPDFPALTVDELTAAMRETARIGVPLLVHAEFTPEHSAATVRTYSDYLARHPADLEDAAVLAVLDAARRTGARVHITHLSSANTVPALAAARPTACG